MAADIEQDFEAGSNGTTVAAGNTNGSGQQPVASVTTSGATTCTFSNLAIALARGSLTMRISCPVGAAGYARFNFSPTATTTRVADHFYFYVVSGAPTAGDLIQVRNSSGNASRVGFATGSKLAVLNAAGTVVATGTTTIATGTLYRVDLVTKVGTTTSNGTIEAYLYAGHSTTPLETLYSSSAANTGTTALTNVRLGTVSNWSTGGTVVIHFDDFKMGERASGVLPPSVTSTAWPIDSTTVAVTTTSSDIAAVHPLSSTTPAVSATTAPAINAVHPLSSQTDAVTAASAAINVVHPLSSATPVVSATSATVNVVHPLGSTTPVVTAVQSAFTLRAALASSSPVVTATPAPALNVAHPLSSSTPVVSAYGANLADNAIASTTAVVSGTPAPAIALRAALASTLPVVSTTPAAAISARHPLASTTPIVSATSSAPKLRTALVSVLPILSSFASAPALAALLDSVTDCITTYVADLSVSGEDPPVPDVPTLASATLRRTFTSRIVERSLSASAAPASLESATASRILTSEKGGS